MNKYQLMNDSNVTDEYGNNYPDLATFPLNELRLTQKPANYELTECDLYRFFDLSYNYYDKFDFYDYITLWLNDINEIGNEKNLGKSIKFFGKNDLDKWYAEHLKS